MVPGTTPEVLSQTSMLNITAVSLTHWLGEGDGFSKYTSSVSTRMGSEAAGPRFPAMSSAQTYTNTCPSEAPDSCPGLP